MLNSADKISKWVFRFTLILEPVKAIDLVEYESIEKASLYFFSDVLQFMITKHYLIFVNE